MKDLNGHIKIHLNHNYFHRWYTEKRLFMCAQKYTNEYIEYNSQDSSYTDLEYFICQLLKAFNAIE